MPLYVRCSSFPVRDGPVQRSDGKCQDMHGRHSGGDQQARGGEHLSKVHSSDRGSRPQNWNVSVNGSRESHKGARPGCRYSSSHTATVVFSPSVANIMPMSHLRDTHRGVSPTFSMWLELHFENMFTHAFHGLSSTLMAFVRVPKRELVKEIHIS